MNRVFHHLSHPQSIVEQLLAAYTKAAGNRFPAARNRSNIAACYSAITARKNCVSPDGICRQGLDPSGA